MKLWRRVVIGVLVVVVGVPLLFVGMVHTNAWYRRRKVEQLLKTLKRVRPGETTQSEYLTLIQPFQASSYEVEIGGEVRPDALAIGNRSEWIERALSARQFFVENLLPGHVIPAFVSFNATPTYAGGLVSQLDIEEETSVSGRPPGAFVHWSASRYEGGDFRFGDDFSGYHMSQMGLEGGKPWEFHLKMDQRATAEERNRALGFSFRCFTKVSMCGDAALYLNPAPNR